MKKFITIITLGINIVLKSWKLKRRVWNKVKTVIDKDGNSKITLAEIEATLTELDQGTLVMFISKK